MKSPHRLPRFVSLLAVAGLLLSSLSVSAQQPPAPGGGAPAQGGPGGPGGPGGGRGRGQPPPPPVPDDYAGFKPIFDGTTLNGWDGDPRFWRVEGGSIIGQSTPDKFVNPNSFLIWRAGTVKNFELKVDWRFTSGEAGNSGVQYRSKEMPEVAKWVLGGYQADMDPVHRNTGLLYEERGRGFASRPGSITRRVDGGTAKLIGTTGTIEELRATMKPSGEWNTYHIIAKDNVITQVLNGRIINMLIDDEVEKRAMEGLIGLQIHQGPPMQVEFRNIQLKTLP